MGREYLVRRSRFAGWQDIRASLRDPQCKGPEQVYSIAMDVGKEEHRALLNKLHLLFGVVTYSAGKLG